MGFERDRKKPSPGRWRGIALALSSAAIGATVATFVVSGHVKVPSLQATAATHLNPPKSEVQSDEIATMALGHSQSSIVGAVKRVEPAVMGVVNYGQVSDFFSQQTKLEATGVGTGVLFYKDKHSGYIVTNNHVVEGAVRVEVVLDSGRHVKASVVGTDRYTDLAVLKAPLSSVKGIAPVAFANSDKIEPGQTAIAIGTPMGLDFADSVTAGIVSAKKRIMPVEEPETQQVLDYQAVIQTDAAINPGNSGGPLVDMAGQVIGINSSKIVAQNFEGMGFAIPSNEVRSIARQIMQDGHAVHPSLGIQGYSLSSLPEQWWPDVPVDYGVWVKAVYSPAAQRAGLQAQDVIVGIDSRSIRSMADLRTYLFEEKPGKVVDLHLYRGQQRVNVRVELGQMKTDNTAARAQSEDIGSGFGTGLYSTPDWGAEE